MRAIIFVVCSISCFGAGYYTGVRRTCGPQTIRLTDDLKHTRRVAVSCHEMVADHWSLNHQTVLGSKEIVTVSRQIADSLRKEE